MRANKRTKPTNDQDESMLGTKKRDTKAKTKTNDAKDTQDLDEDGSIEDGAAVNSQDDADSIN
jgi:hypothetical protein